MIRKRKKLCLYIELSIILTLVTSGLIFAWYRIETPIINTEQKNLQLTFFNGINNGTHDLEIDYKFDFNDKLKTYGNISDDYDTAIACPVTIFFMLYSNLTIRIFGISHEHLHWEGIEEGVRFSYQEDNRLYNFFWYKSETNIEKIEVVLYVDGVITRFDKKYYSFNCDTMVYNERNTYLNNTIAVNHTISLRNMDSKRIKIEEHNMHFERSYNGYESSSFQDVERYIIENTEIVRIKMDIKLSTLGSRIRSNTSLIFLTLVVEFPLLTIIQLFIVKRYEKAFKKLEKQTKVEDKDASVDQLNVDNEGGSEAQRDVENEDWPNATKMTTI